MERGEEKRTLSLLLPYNFEILFLFSLFVFPGMKREYWPEIGSNWDG